MEAGPRALFDEALFHSELHSAAAQDGIGFSPETGEYGVMLNAGVIDPAELLEDRPTTQC